MDVLLSVAAIWIGTVAASEPPTATQPSLRRVQADEVWEMRDGRFFRNDVWVFLKTGKILRAFEKPEAADQLIPDIDTLIDRLHYNSFSLNIYPDAFDEDGDGQIDASHQEAYHNIGRILDHCWQRGVFCSLSFETYNVGGGGTPAALFMRHPEISAMNALGEPARDVEYGGEQGKLIPSVYHPVYLDWSRGFIRRFLQGLGEQRAAHLLFVETTVEPQYLGGCSIGDKDPKRAFLDFSTAAHAAFDRWQATFSPDDPHRRELKWPASAEERGKLLGNQLFNDFRAWGLAEWVSGDAQAIRSVAPLMYVVVDYNGRFDDEHNLRLGTREVFLAGLKGIDVIQIAPHPLEPWGTTAWDDVIAANRKYRKHWAISEHMTATGSWGQDDREMTTILENTLARGTRWGWDLVNAGNRHATDDYHLYDEDWHSQTLDIIEGSNRPAWIKKIGAPPFVPRPRR